MVEDFQTAIVVFAGAAGAGQGIAAIVTASYRGRATLLRAKRGDPELIYPKTMPTLFQLKPGANSQQ